MKVPIWVYIWVIAFSILGAIVVAYDKSSARHGGWRVPERSLWILAVLGGALVMWFSCVSIHHKTQRKRFMFGLPLLVIVQAFVLYFLVRADILNFVPAFY